jgi:iron complex transport system permease protein
MFKFISILLLTFIGSSVITLNGEGPSTSDYLNFIFSSTSVEKSDVIKSILFDIRLPRNLLAMLSGASLALAGAISQGVFRNSLASPSILGTNAGGVLAAILVFHFGLAWESSFYLPGASILGSIGSTLLVLAIFSHQRMQSLGALLLLGFSLNAFLTGMTSFVLSFLLNDYEKSTSALRWILGSYSAASWNEVWIVLSTFILGLGVSIPLAYKIDVLSLGSEIARTLSVNPDKLKTISIVSLSILVGGSISVAGGIPFVGLIVPHICRMFVGPNHKKLFVASIINGATLTLICDFIARNIRYPEELEIGALTTLTGAPFFIWLLIKNNKTKEGHLI